MPLTMQNLVALCWKISGIWKSRPKSSWRNRPKFTKFGHRVLTGQTPDHVKFHRCHRNSVREKCYKIFLHPSLFGAPGGTFWAKVHQSQWWHTGRHPLSSCQISSPSDNPSTRYLLPKFVDFVDGVTDKKNKNHIIHSEWYSLRITMQQLTKQSPCRM